MKGKKVNVIKIKWQNKNNYDQINIYKQIEM